MADFEKIGALILRDGRVLLCRKRRDTSRLILPGGRIEPGESDVACLARELREELGDVTLARAERIGAYQDRAALDDPSAVKTVRITLYRCEIAGEPAPAAEIGELIWFGPDADPALLSPILVNRIFPDLLARGLLPWGGR
jgi:8-oxo-dGTP diphosphatase